MDATGSRGLRRRLSLGQTATVLLLAVAVWLQLWVVAAALLVLAIGVTIVWFRVPDVEDPDPELPDAVAAQLRQRRDSGGEVGAVRALREQYPNLGLAQAVRIVRAL